ncbi:MAG: ABC transporter substrate-binding protein [Deinococcales bacterium]
MIIYPPSEAATQRSHPIGTGPFKFVSYTPGSEVVLERNPDYYIKGEPYLDKVVFKIMSDPNTRFAALQAGDINMIASALPPEQYLQVEKGSVPGVKGTQGTATTEMVLALNNARAPFNNKLVREAITMAINKKAIVDGAMFGLGTVIGTHMTPAEPYFINPDPYPYNPAKAKQLLAQAGYPNGFKTKLELPQPYPDERRTGQVIAQQLKQVGIDAQVSVVEWTTWLNRIFLGGDYDMTVIGHSEPRDIGIYANPKYYFHYNNPVVQNLLKQAEAATSTPVQTADYQEIGKIIADDAVNVWVFSPPYLVAAQNDIYGFWTNQPTPSIDMTRVYIAH